MITKDNIVRHELIGLKVKVTSSTNKTIEGLAGLVVDETKNMLFIEKRNGKVSMVAKKDCTFSFILPNGERVLVSGKDIVGRPEDRIKRKKR
ncbi:MAG TPA: ribonuclease P protein subunit [Candidatus Aenigmarchaeota archaeon]|nr:MAG: ribonuclease P protein subunit [Candidatus Aenigmarchaeota archaeon]HDD46072.1 ribonuclease P protein subunit [Candidatus Aenigmarchaeota archaeon]